MPIHRAIVLAGCALTLALAGGGMDAQGARPSQKEISKELARLYEEDHADQAEWTDDSRSDYFSRRQTERAARVNVIVAAGQLGSLEDFQNACWILQHGDTPEDYLLAHVLSLPPGVKGLPFKGFASAATLDRFLQSIERAQIFSTQSGSPDPSSFMPLEPFDSSMPASIRKAYELDPLPNASKDPPKDAKASPKELPKLLRAAEAERQPPAAGTTPDWLARTRAIVAAGALKSDDDYALAARLLLRSPESADLLMAHVLAGAAALRGSEDGLPLSAETLDRFLVAIGRPARFGTEGEKGDSSQLLHETIRKQYGLASR